MRTGPLKQGCEVGRNSIETVQIVIVDMMLDLDELRIRTEQAMRRTSSVADVLAPGLERLEKAQQNLELMQAELVKFAKAQHAARWGGG